MLELDVDGALDAITIVVAVAGLVTALVGSAAGAQPVGGLDHQQRQAQAFDRAQLAAKTGSTAKAPRGPNPSLALVPDPSAVDFASWRRYIAQKSQERAEARAGALASPILVDEDEPDGTRGSNDTPATAQPVPGLGTLARHAARILGTLSPEEVEIDSIAPNTENDGAIHLARDTGIGTTRDGITTTGTIGDGPHGRAGTGNGDFDHYRVRAVAGDVITVDTATPSGSLDTMISVFNTAGEEVAFNDDSGATLDSHIEYVVPANGRFSVAIAGFRTFQSDPYDSASGLGFGSEGPYEVTISVGEADRDFYAINLRKGDVLGTTVSGAPSRIAIYDPSGDEVMGSSQDATFIYSPLSPLPGGGNAVAEHVADESGWHYVSVEGGDGRYDITVEAYRPPLETERPIQTRIWTSTEPVSTPASGVDRACGRSARCAPSSAAGG
ncbi:MAG: hypothetical protein H0U21_04135 [Acidimicrobiia bacterium]|nr:hypothetical protein [Acidimicrobiia bacterium]